LAPGLQWPVTGRNEGGIGGQQQPVDVQTTLLH
jgi:hypothetical protein